MNATGVELLLFDREDDLTVDFSSRRFRDEEEVCIPPLR
jgi:hypothetical protein